MLVFCLVTECVPGQAGQGLGQPDLTGGIPAYGRRVELGEL